MRFALMLLGLAWAMPGFAGKIPAAQLAASHGYVYVNFPKGSHDILGLEPTGGGKVMPLEVRADAGKNAYGAWLPAGSYRIAKWGAYDWKESSSFEVRAGRITDLGGLVAINVGGYEIVFASTYHPENSDGVGMAMAEFAGILAEPQPLTWQTSTPMKPIMLGQPHSGLGLIADLLVAYDRKVNKPSIIGQLKAASTTDELLRIARTVTPPMSDEPAIAADGTLYFGADLGAVRVRRPDGTWSSFHSDTLRTISAVELEGDDLLAGSDNGVIRRSADQGQSWSIVKTLRPVEAIVDIDHADGIWVVTTNRPGADAGPRNPSLVMAVYTARRSDLADLALSREFDSLGWLGSRGQLVNGRYFITTLPTLQRLDLGSMEWKAITPDGKVGSQRVNPDTGVVTALWSQGAFSKIFVSTDHGDTWKKLGRPPYVIADVQMDAADRGYASRWNMNAFSGEWEIYRYDAAKDDWTMTVKAPFNCKPLRVASAMPVLCIANDASIFRQASAGWEVEFSAQ